MVLRHSVVIQQRVMATDGEGGHTYTYSTLKTIKADVQPISASPEELRAWGIVDIGANARAMYFKKDPSIDTLQRVVYDGKAFEIRNINSWSIHDKALLVPVVGV